VFSLSRRRFFVHAKEIGRLNEQAIQLMDWIVDHDTQFGKADAAMKLQQRKLALSRLVGYEARYKYANLKGQCQFSDSASLNTEDIINQLGWEVSLTVNRNQNRQGAFDLEDFADAVLKSQVQFHETICNALAFVVGSILTGQTERCSRLLDGPEQVTAEYQSAQEQAARPANIRGIPQASQTAQIKTRAQRVIPSPPPQVQQFNPETTETPKRKRGAQEEEAVESHPPTKRILRQEDVSAFLSGIVSDPPLSGSTKPVVPSLLVSIGGFDKQPASVERQYTENGSVVALLALDRSQEPPTINPQVIGGKRSLAEIDVSDCETQVPVQKRRLNDSKPCDASATLPHLPPSDELLIDDADPFAVFDFGINDALLQPAHESPPEEFKSIPEAISPARLLQHHTLSLATASASGTRNQLDEYPEVSRYSTDQVHTSPDHHPTNLQHGLGDHMGEYPQVPQHPSAQVQTHPVQFSSQAASDLPTEETFALTDAEWEQFLRDYSVIEPAQVITAPEPLPQRSESRVNPQQDSEAPYQGRFNLDSSGRMNLLLQQSVNIDLEKISRSRNRRWQLK
jgi:hypothetical protein